MKSPASVLLLAVAVSFASCKGHEKKILVYATGSIQADNTQKNITVSDGTTHHEQVLTFNSGDPVKVEAQTPAGKVTIEAAEDGLYLANLKNDTLLGSYQHVGTDVDNRITQDALKQKLDSLQKLLTGSNVSVENRNFFILPGKTVKITNETKAKVFGPFTTIPGGFDAGSVPEIYKFYSIKEIREIVGNLSKMTIAK